MRVAVKDILSTEKVDLVSPEQQLLKQILETLRSVESKLPNESAENGDNGENVSGESAVSGPEGELPEETGETGGAGL